VIVVTAAIVANALWLQPKRHPAPYFMTRESAAAESATPDELVRAIQDALKQVGYYSGPLDGLPGPMTRSSILAFEKESGREPQGEPTSALLEAIRSANRAGSAPDTLQEAIEQAPAVTSAPAELDPRVAAVQRALALAAYGPVGSDGVVGPQTTDAIKRFQRDHNLAVTGEISDGLIIELRAAGALDEE
jgi:peptidoglycan hydrolase-like protein with peptidoglycan-binding domain